MSALPSFSLDDIEDIDDVAEGFVRSAHEGEELSERRCRLHCVRWGSPDKAVVVMKEVHLWEEDTVTSDVHTIAARVALVQSTTTAKLFVQYLALHVDNAHHYQWLLQRCGPSLKTILDNEAGVAAAAAAAPITEAQCQSILRRVLAALMHLHSVNVGMIHGDLSLSNILLARPGGEVGEVVLGDLEALTPVDTVVSGSLGAVLYTAPERLEDGDLPASAADDMWAFGVVAFQLLTGCSRAHPWLPAGAPSEALRDFWRFLEAMHTMCDVTPLDYLEPRLSPTCSRDALSVVAACLAWDRRERPTAAALLEFPWFASA